MNNPEFIISKVTSYDEDDQLYSTKVGVQMRSMPLHYTCHGKSEAESRQRAEELVDILTNHYVSKTNLVKK